MKDMWFTAEMNPSNILEDASLNWKVEKQPILLPSGEEIPNKKALIQDINRVFYRVVPEDFDIIQTDEFLELTKSVAKNVWSAGQSPDGEIVWFTTKPQEQYRTFQIDNDIYENYILFAMSYTSTLGISIIPITVNTSRNLTYNVSEMLQKEPPTIRQTKNIHARSKDLSTFNSMHREATAQLKEFELKLRRLSDNKEHSFLEILDDILPIEGKTGNALTRALKLRDAIADNHEKPTSLYSFFTAIYATDMEKIDKRRSTLARRFLSGKTSTLAKKVVSYAA